MIGRGESHASQIHDVWADTFEAEFNEFLAAAADVNTLLAVDIEFPGSLGDEPFWLASSSPERYQVLRESINILQPIQVGIAVAGADGTFRGTWNFNLHFDVETNLHIEASVSFLSCLLYTSPSPRDS